MWLPSQGTSGGGSCQASARSGGLPERLAAAAMEVWEQCRSCKAWLPLDKATGAVPAPANLGLPVTCRPDLHLR